MSVPSDAAAKQDASHARTGGDAPGETFATAYPEPSASDSAFLAPAEAAGELGQLGGYRVLNVLGKGGMGMVFLAEDVQLKRRIALKVMRPEIAAKEDARRRFLREAQTAAAIEHDNIIAIYHVGEDRGVPYLAMPFLQGETLADRLEREGKLPPKEAWRITREIAEGLAAAHARGLIHRDIKPSNIWLEARSQEPGVRGQESGVGDQGTGKQGEREKGGRVKILDFGLARLTDAEGEPVITASGAVLGTPAYMAPEQAAGDKVDARADLFSLGCVLYHMETGQLPFQGANVMAVLTALATQHPEAPSTLNPDVPKPMSDLVVKLLAKDPADRPQTARAVVEALTAMVQRSAPPVATPTQQILKVFDFSKRTAIVELERPTQTAVGPRRQRDSVPSSTGEETGWRERARRRWPLIAAAAGVLAAAFAIYQVTFQTPHGTLIVQVDDPEVEVRFKNGELHLFDKDGKLKYTLKPSARNQDVAAGKYRISVAGADGLRLDVPEFTLTKGGKQTVRVTLAPAVVAKKKGGEKLAPEKAPGNYALEFDGKTSYVNVHSLDKLQLIKENPRHPFTVEATVCASSHAAKGGSHVFIGFPLRLQQYSWEFRRWRGSAWTADEMRYRESDNAAELERVTHLAAVYDGKTIHLFVNGKPQFRSVKQFRDGKEENAPAEFSLAYRVGMSTIAAAFHGPESYKDLFHGLIDEVRISKVARYTKDYAPAKRFEPDADTLALYHFDEGEGDMLKDSSGNGHHGKIVGTKWVKVDDDLKVIGGPKLPENYALEFDGKASHAVVYSLGKLQLTKENPRQPLTVEATVWASSHAPKGERGVFVGFPLRLRQFTWEPFPRWRGGAWTDDIGYRESDNALELERTTHLAAVYDGKTIHLFVNGKPQSRPVTRFRDGKVEDAPAEFSLVDRFGMTTIGAGYGAEGHKDLFLGIIDEVRISKVARYTKDYTPSKRFENDKDTLALYHFDEGEGDVLNDSSGNGHHGKNLGARWVKVDDQLKVISSGKGDGSFSPPDPARLKKP